VFQRHKIKNNEKREELLGFLKSRLGLLFCHNFSIFRMHPLAKELIDPFQQDYRF
jgi:hypothetical protein